MKYCRNCGKEIDENSSYCPECGAYVGDGPEQQNEQFNYQQPTKQNNDVDGNNAGFNVLSFFFPLIGLILYLVWKNQLPLRAKGCGKWALIGFITNIVISICYVVLVFGIIAGAGV